MPNMKEGRWCHSLVVLKNKLFVIGGGDRAASEVYDRNSKNFVTLKSPFAIDYNISLLIGTKIMIFQDEDSNNSSIVTYDAHNDKWSEESCETVEKLLFYSCVKLPIC